MAEPKWKKFERLVAAIHRAQAAGADVMWNESICGRQFDVVLRFTVGAYKYVTVIECKDQQRGVSVDEVEAFVTKSRDAGADKSVMVSSVGYQKGAFEVAARHHVELFGLSFIDEVPTDLLSNELFPCISINDLTLLREDGQTKIRLPEHKNLPPYLATHLTFTHGSTTRPLHELIDDELRPCIGSLSSEPRRMDISLDRPTTAYLPHLCVSVAVTRLVFYAKLSTFKILKQHGVDPHVMKGVYAYRDYKTGQTTEIPKFQVKVAYDTVLKQGHFYENPGLEFSYYCISIASNFANLLLVESYQHGILIQAEYSQSLAEQSEYIKITDPVEIARLSRVGAGILKDYHRAV